MMVFYDYAVAFHSIDLPHQRDVN